MSFTLESVGPLAQVKSDLAAQAAAASAPEQQTLTAAVALVNQVLDQSKGDVHVHLHIVCDSETGQKPPEVVQPSTNGPLGTIRKDLSGHQRQSLRIILTTTFVG
jgi:hypothetical protein